MQTSKPSQRRPLRIKRSAEPVDPMTATGAPPTKEELFEALVNRAVQRGYIDGCDLLTLRTIDGKWDSWHLHQQFGERMRKRAFGRRKPWPPTIVTSSDGAVTVSERQV